MAVNHLELFIRQGSVREVAHESLKRDFSIPQMCVCPLARLWCEVSQEEPQSTTGFSWTTEQRKHCCRLCKDFQKSNAYLSVPAEPPHLCLQHTRPASAYLLLLSTHPNIHPDGAGIGLPGASILALDLIGGHPVFLLLAPGWSLREQMISSLLCPRIALQSCCFHRPAWVWFS